jgi:hypothetical protein
MVIGAPANSINGPPILPPRACSPFSKGLTILTGEQENSHAIPMKSITLCIK